MMVFNAELLSTTPALIKGGETLSVDRTGTITFTNGRPVKSDQTNFDIIANVQPLTGKEILQLEEGDRDRQHLNVFTATQIKVNDLIERDQKTFEVQIVEAWGSYFRARMVLQDVV